MNNKKNQVEDGNNKVILNLGKSFFNLGEIWSHKWAHRHQSIFYKPNLKNAIDDYLTLKTNCDFINLKEETDQKIFCSKNEQVRLRVINTNNIWKVVKIKLNQQQFTFNLNSYKHNKLIKSKLLTNKTKKFLNFSDKIDYFLIVF